MFEKLSIPRRDALGALVAGAVALLTAAAPAAAIGSGIAPHGQTAERPPADAGGPASPFGEDGPTTPHKGSSINPDG